MSDKLGKNRNTHSEYLILIPPHGNSGYADAPQWYVIRTLSVLFNVKPDGTLN